MKSDVMQKVANAINLHLSFKREVQSLENDGYYVLFNSRTMAGEVVKLAHRVNGRRLTLILYSHAWEIREHSKVIKHVEPIVKVC